MSVDQAAEREPEKTQGQEASVQNAPGASTAEAAANPVVAKFRKGFYTDSRFGLLMALGEEPEDYKRMMESLMEDLEPREGLESQLVEQIAETFWRMRRAQRMRDGLALKSIQSKTATEDVFATMQASQALDALEPYEQLKEALSRRGGGPTEAEIDEFVKSRNGNSSEEMREFIALIESLKGPMEERKRKATRREARDQLRRLMEPYASLAWQTTRRCEKVHSPENLAALMAMDNQKGVLLQRLEDSHLRRLLRLTNTFAKVRQGGLQKKDVKK